MKTLLSISMIIVALNLNTEAGTYPIVDTGQIRCYNNTSEITYPISGRAFFGQDAHYNGHQPSYQDHGDGTVTDQVTGLMWIQNPGTKKTYAQAVAGATRCQVGGHKDWRLPTIKELYSLILFSGRDLGPMQSNSAQLRPFIDTRYFRFQYGNPQLGERMIDSQFVTSTLYRSTTMGGHETMFGVNFADGRIKGYPINMGSRRGGRGEKTYYVLYVRNNPSYGQNQFVDNGDGTITDKATGLMWMKADSGSLKAGRNGNLNWQQALDFADNLDHAGHSDWRLPNAKELHSLVDYTRCPDVTNSPAIDPIFHVTSIKNEGGGMDYPHYWTSTTHASMSRASAGVYIAFGRALGFMSNPRTGSKTLMDVHGAGAQRSDDKSGNPARYSQGRGPQGDVVRIYNMVRCVRGGVAEPRTSGPKVEMTSQRSMRAMPFSSGMRHPGQGPSGGSFVQRLDKNGDGKVSRQEFDGPSQHFTHFDKNKDGYLSESEAPQGPPPQRNASRPRR